MRIVADFHIHSPYSRAVSKEMTLENLDLWALLKGIGVMGTGDFTHPKWMQEIKAKLEPAEEGLYVLKSQIPSTKSQIYSKFQIPNSETRFILTVEISSIYSKGGRVRRIHNIIFMPSIASAEKFNAVLGWRGNLKSDGRPILGLDAKELAKIAFDTDPRAVVVPAHCLLPKTLIHTNADFLTSIDQIKKGDEVYTHEGRWRSVEKVLKRSYSGKIFSIRPYYFRQGLTTTPEHPFYAIKTKKNCHWSKGICKPAHEKDSSCTKKHYRSYTPQWIPASSVEVGDVLVFPRFQHIYDNHAVVDIQEFAKKEIVIRSESVVKGGGTRSIALPRMIPIDKDFCRLVGYFLAEGYINGRDAIGFTFHSKEKEYIRDVVVLVQNIFGETVQPVYRDFSKNGTEITFYSKILQEFFSNFCYESRFHSAATKAMPLWMLGLKPELQVEIFRGWWRGDKGYTVSRALMNQLKIILLRIGIIPSIYEERQDDHKRRGNHIFNGREIFARRSLYSLARLTFFEDPFDLLREPEFAHFRAASSIRHGWMDEKYAYLPVRDITVRRYNGEVYNLEVADDNSYTTEFATVHNCWTPWFSVFGSMSGFNSLEECFDEYARHIFAIETGLSCYDTKTEVLTESGWKKFSRVTKADKICTLNPNTEEIEYQNPTKVYRSRYRGKMYRLKTKRADLLVTPNHNLFYAPADFHARRPYRLKEARDLFGKSKILRKDGVWKGEIPKYFTLPEVKIHHGSRFYSGFRTKAARKFLIQPWLKFFGLWVAEGWTTEGENGHYAVCISNQNYRLMAEMKHILENFGYTVFWDKKVTNTIRVRDYQLFHYLQQFGKASNKYVPAEVKDLSKELLGIFLEYYIKGDGHVYGRNGKGLSATTISVRLRDDLQEIALKIGVSAYYKLHQKRGTPFVSPSQKKIYKQSADSWNVYFIRRNRHAIIPSMMKKYRYEEEWVDYDGAVYCVSVPNRVVYIRRNGIPLWCGNSDPAMNWRLSALDRIALLSNSDSHSLHRIGREANVFELPARSYDSIIDAIRTKDPKKFLSTVEFFPEEGKYHYDGHRACGISMSPEETKKVKKLCPKCGKPLTVGVLYRVDELADRPVGARPKGAIPYKNLVPLDEIIAESFGVGAASKRVQTEYHTLLGKLGSEFSILIDASDADLKSAAPPEVYEGIRRVREGSLHIEPGYDGEYGIVKIFTEEERRGIATQKPLF